MSERLVLFSASSSTWLRLNLEELSLELAALDIRLVEPDISLHKFSNVPEVPDNYSNNNCDCPAYMQYYLSVIREEHWKHIPLREKLRFIARHRPIFDEQINRLGSQIKDNISGAVVVQGFEPANAIIREAAIRQGINILAIENSMLRDRVVWDNVAGVNTNRSLAGSYFLRYLDVVDAAPVDQLICDLLRLTPQLKTRQHASPAGSVSDAFISKLSGRPYCLFLGQVYTDSSLLFGIDNWQSPLACLWSVYQWTKKVGLDLVVKLHPKEYGCLGPVTYKPYDKLTWRKLNSFPLFEPFLQDPCVTVDFKNECDTYRLIDESHCVATINSQAGLEAAIRDKPVIVMGDSFYSDLGFTNDWKHPKILEAASLNALNKNTARARKFAYIFLEKYCVSKEAKKMAVLIKQALSF
jgi:hypothetical protein